MSWKDCREIRKLIWSLEHDHFPYELEHDDESLTVYFPDKEVAYLTFTEGPGSKGYEEDLIQMISKYENTGYLTVAICRERVAREWLEWL